MANVTIAIDDEVLRRARLKAAEHGTSVNAVVREALKFFVSVDERKRAIDEFLRKLGWTVETAAAVRTFSALARVPVDLDLGDRQPVC